MTTETTTTQYTEEDIRSEIKPLVSNPFLAFFQKIWRKWLEFWYAFSDKHEKLAKIIYQLVIFIIICQGVTIFQFLIFLFLPEVFGLGLAGTEWLWPKVELSFYTEGGPWYFSMLGYAVLTNTAGEVVIGGGLGYFLAFAIGTFLAQCINFPLQRNITFKSHGKVSVQIIWYFIGWVGIQLLCGGLASLWLPLANGALGFALPTIVVTLLSTIIMGGVSMVIFFVIFLIIFPDYAVAAARLQKKLEAAKAAGAEESVIADLEAKYFEAQGNADFTAAEKAASQTATQASAKAVAYVASIEKNLSEETVKESYEAAYAAIEAKNAAAAAFEEEKAKKGVDATTEA